MFKFLMLLFIAIGGFTGVVHAADPERSSDVLAAVLRAQPEDIQSRYAARHPQETLDFFGFKPGQTIVEVLPGAGWYSRIMVAYLGPKGCLIGADYAADMYPRFGYLSKAELKAKDTWVQDWTAQARQWAGKQGARVEAFQLGALPEAMRGTADGVLLVRALHNLAHFENDGGYLTHALQDIYDVLKPGGIVGVVQHEARDDMPDEWAAGQNGYLKKSFVITRMLDMGFEYVGSSPINQNERDQPGLKDQVWRLPPTLETSANDPDLKAKMEAIGESNRMTLKFRKPL